MCAHAGAAWSQARLEDERMAAVAACKYVHAVVPNAPVSHLVSKAGEAPTRSEEMVDEYKLHLFAVGQEYEVPKKGKPDYYELPRARGMIRYTQRTEGVSTSELIRRIASRADEFVEGGPVSPEKGQG